MIQPVAPSLLILPGGRAAPRAPGEGAVFALPAEGESGVILLPAGGSEGGSGGRHDDAAPGNVLPIASVTTLTPSAVPLAAPASSPPPATAVSTPVLPAMPVAPVPMMPGDEQPLPREPVPSDQLVEPLQSPAITAPAASRTTLMVADTRTMVAAKKPAESPAAALATGMPEPVAAPAPPSPAPLIGVAAPSSSSPTATPSVPDATQASSTAPVPAPRIAAVSSPSERPDDTRPAAAETTSPAPISVSHHFSATWPNRATPSPDTDTPKDDEAAGDTTPAIETAPPAGVAAPMPAIVVAAHPADPPLPPGIAATERETAGISPARLPSRAGMTATASRTALSAGSETATLRDASPANPVTSFVTTAADVTTVAAEHAAAPTPPTDAAVTKVSTPIAPPALPTSDASLVATTSRAGGASPAVATAPPSTVISVPRRFASTWPTRATPPVAPDAITPRGLPPVVLPTAGITVPAPAGQIVAPTLPTEPPQPATEPADPAPMENSTAPATSPAATAVTSAPASTPIPAAAPAGIVFGAARFAAQTADDRDEPAVPIGLAPLAAPVMERTAAALPQPPLDVTQERWPHAMIERIEMIRDAAKEVDTRIRLVPDALGAIDVDVRRDGDTLHVRFQADQPQTRALLADAAPRLAEAAEARGLRLGQSSVGSGQGDGAAGHGQQQRPSLPAAPPRAPVSSTAAGPADGDDIRLA